MSSRSLTPRYKVWVIGLARTGTTTLCSALKLLGYERIVHNPLFEQLRDLDAAADNGCTVFYKYLDYKFPSSKFVLTMRDTESWLESMEYIFGRYPCTREDDIAIQRRMLLYGTVGFDRTKLIESYRHHANDVRQYFVNRPNDLLEMNVLEGDGWEKLCPFLETETPPVPFPHSNKRYEGD